MSELTDAMSFSVEYSALGEALMLKLLNAVSPETSSYEYTGEVCSAQPRTCGQQRTREPLAEKSDAPIGTRTNEKPAPDPPSVGLKSSFRSAQYDPEFFDLSAASTDADESVKAAGT
jgi:hypothetical protein